MDIFACISYMCVYGREIILMIVT